MTRWRPWAHPSLGLAGDEQEDDPEEDARETTSTSPGRAESIMAMRWCCDRRSSRLTTLPTALLSLSAASKQPSDAHPLRRHWVPLPEIPTAPGRHCCPRVSLSEASGTHCCYVSRPCEPHSLPTVPLIWTGDKAAFCTKVGVPQGLEALEARHMRERAKEGRGREAEQAHPQQRRPRQAHVDEPVDAHACADNAA